MAFVRRNLLVDHRGASSRQRVTCRYKCADACFHPAPNTSANQYFGDVARAVSRRSVLRSVYVQHPGESDDNSLDDPLSRWPEGPGGTARPSVVVVWRDAGDIGL